MQRGRAPPRQHQPGRPQPRKPPSVKVNRREVPPTLVRVFARHHTHHSDVEFAPNRLPLRDEVQVRDTTLRELLVLLRDAAPDLRSAPLARYSVRHVYFDTRDDRFVSKDLATITARDLVKSSAAPPPAADYRLGRTLADFDYVAGDFFDVAYLTSSGPTVPPGSGPVAPGQFAVVGAAGRISRRDGERGWSGGRGTAQGPNPNPGRPTQNHPWAVRGTAGTAQRQLNIRPTQSGDLVQAEKFRQSASPRDRSPSPPRARSQSRSPVRRDSPRE
ncbi:hypothetical protein OIV83_001569 [Microbotryomycetes sp. JL201]|nr:hypothetical protein OIV83_001569 [Microbotryomycetes sp. JL201]